MGINLLIAVTDGDWFEMLRRQSDLSEVNFWAPSAANFRALQAGELFLFKLHAPRNVIVGGGIFVYANALPCSLAWEAFGETNGARHWKPRTLAVNLNYYENNILPCFRGRLVADITRREVLEWFESLHAKPASANRSLPVLSVILRQAEVYRYRPEDSNPCKDIKRYRRRVRERFLSPDEIRRVVEVLNRYVETRPFQVAVIRLLLLTGCRKGELLTLKWQDYREGKLFLRDSKSGPRTVWLSSATREVLDRLHRKNEWVFPSPYRYAEHLAEITDFWQEVRAEAGLHEVRVHDLRHSCASWPDFLAANEVIKRCN